ncbi:MULTISPECIES: hypothetical protein [Streptomyces]|uniref:hypothetical protein n=1 Tax=Streptomyces TaxID=1883 RepID=UPI0033EC90CD
MTIGALISPACYAQQATAHRGDARNAKWPAPAGPVQPQPGVWGREADAWTNDDFDELDAVWSIVIEDLGSDYDTHSNVSSVGWTA